MAFIAKMHLPPLKKSTIWVVDDSVTDSARVKALLTSRYNVEVMPDGALALERLSAGAAPDLMMLDWVMPEISGVEVCRYVRGLSGGVSKIPIILLTANNAVEDVIEAFASGANDYVSKPFVDAELIARVKVLIDGKALLDRAEAAESDLHALIASAPDPIFSVDAQGMITFANDEAVRTLNRPLTDIVGRRFGDVLPGISLNYINVGPGESLLPLPDVTIGEKLYSPSFRILPSDSAATTTVALRDVTARRQADARRLDFYSVIAHDLRTPITAVLLRLQLAFRGVHGVLPAGLLDDLHKTEGSLRSLVGMINDFLELAKLEGVGYKIESQPLDLSQLVTTIADDFKPLMDKKQIVWQTVGFGSKAIVLGSQQRLTQVISNLIGNAVKFNTTGGSITAVLKTSGREVELSIQDTGRGIAAAELPHLFKRFARATEVGDETPGTGLGLMIVREIIEAHGGTIGVESEVGKGSRFWFRLRGVNSSRA